MHWVRGHEGQGQGFGFSNDGVAWGSVPPSLGTSLSKLTQLLGTRSKRSSAAPWRWRTNEPEASLCLSVEKNCLLIPLTFFTEAVMLRTQVCQGIGSVIIG